MTLNQAREEVCRIGRSLFERGLVHATAGNISLRLDAHAGGGLLITPSDACLGWLDPAQLAYINPQGQQVSGARASKTLALHQSIYQSACAFDPATRCVIHTHSTHCVALSLRATPEQTELLQAITPYFVMKVGHVPLLPYARPGAAQTAQAVAQVISAYGQRGQPVRAVMLARLGPNVWHDSPAAAMATLEELEETARLSLLQPDATPLGAQQIEELRQAFGARW